MVKLTDKLMEILDSRKNEFDGEEIKMIAEAIAISEGIPEKVEIDPNAKSQEQIIKDWLGV
jgi:hypothetical protein